MSLASFSFPQVNCRYGAPLGRAQRGDYDPQKPLRAEHCGGDGFYDKGGAYWGHSHVYAVYHPDQSFCAYIGAVSAKEAINHVREVFPNE